MPKNRKSGMTRTNEFAKYSFQEQEINFPSMLVDDETKTSGAAAAAAVPMVESSRRLDTLYQLETDLQRIEKEIVTDNSECKFRHNINIP